MCEMWIAGNVIVADDVFIAREDTESAPAAHLYRHGIATGKGI